MAGNFSQSATDVRVDGPILYARLENSDGYWEDAEFDLDQFIGNEDGRFVWGDNGFSQSATDIEFHFVDEKPILRAQLQDRDGHWNDAEINLDEAITNNNGQFEFQYVSCTSLYILRPNY
ncbi:Cyanovirin-N [Aspergillus novoparasiticus]|uniref:Cyanovirin-N n=1 Tax=Aspergillus novoparasiticus TaxID=986946 RepID=A0A5N6ESM3_9EURO|nr:Cyanovirin-N [Aspergillus novoparasiticus]